MNPSNVLEKFLFDVFRDTGRRVLWPFSDGGVFENFDQVVPLLTPEIKELAVAALASGDSRPLDDKVTRIVMNARADFGYGAKRPQEWIAGPADRPDGQDTAGRNEKLRAHHAERRLAGSRRATAETAEKFGISSSRVRAIVRKKPIPLFSGLMAASSALKKKKPRKP